MSAYAPARKDGLKPWCLSYYFRGGTQREIVYALTASEARKAVRTLPKVHSVRRATTEDEGAL